MEDPEDEDEIMLDIKWSGQEYVIAMRKDDSIQTLKRRLGEVTRVLPKRQKLMGLKLHDGKPPAEESIMSDLKLKAGQKVMMIGSQEEAISSVSTSDGDDDVLADFGEEEILKTLAPHEDPDVLEKLEKRIRKVEVKILNPPRKGKKLLVIDIDYTIFDLGSPAEMPMHLARPHLHKFLEEAYQDYDIVIWSANSMKWMKVKMDALGVLTSDKFKVTFMLDYKSMLTVHSSRKGVFDCKPLQVIWAKFGEFYTEENTIMLDDLKRNFILNKQNGLVIKPYQKYYKNRSTDRELVQLKYYLKIIAKLDVLSELNHKNWRRHMSQQCSPEERRQLKHDMEDP